MHAFSPCHLDLALSFWTDPDGGSAVTRAQPLRRQVLVSIRRAGRRWIFYSKRVYCFAVRVLPGFSG